MTQPTGESRQTVFTGPNTFVPEKPAGLVFVHLILFALYPEADEDIRNEALSLMAEMCETEGVIKYQIAESHLKFIDENRENWKKVRVFDSEIAGKK